MIATLAEIKTLLGITGTTYDTQIKLNIPIAEEAICNHCNNDFLDTKQSYRLGYILAVYVYRATLSFVASTNSINDSSSGLAGLNFKIGDSVRVYNSIHNDQIWTIKTVAAGSIVFEDIDTVTNESSTNESILMARLAWPKSLKGVMAKMIKFCIDNKINTGLKSESFDDYSYTNFDVNDYSNGFPKTIMNSCNNYRCLIKKSIPTMPLYIQQL
jgi:hypothetical protein